MRREITLARRVCAVFHRCSGNDVVDDTKNRQGVHNNLPSFLRNQLASATCLFYEAKQGGKQVSNWQISW